MKLFLVIICLVGFTIGWCFQAWVYHNIEPPIVEQGVYEPGDFDLTCELPDNNPDWEGAYLVWSSDLGRLVWVWDF